jgi:hypothetical protein
MEIKDGYCKNYAFHMILHERRALRGCGNSHWRKCQYCKTYDIPENITIDKHFHSFHQSCATKYNKTKRHLRLGITNESMEVPEIEHELIVLREYPAYAVTKDGKVYSLDYWNQGVVRELKQVVSRGYCYVNIWHDRKPSHELVHRLMAMAFLPPHSSDKQEIHHKNNIKNDNRPENLEWISRTENMKNAWKDERIHITEKWRESARRNGPINGKNGGRPRKDKYYFCDLLASK